MAENAARLTATAGEMAGCRDLPMGRHDEKAMSGPEALEAFEKLIRLEKELMALLEVRAERNRKILDQMRGTPADR